MDSGAYKSLECVLSFVTSSTRKPAKELEGQSEAVPLLTVSKGFPGLPHPVTRVKAPVAKAASPPYGWVVLACTLLCLFPSFLVQQSSPPRTLLAHSEGRQHFPPVLTWGLTFAPGREAMHAQHHPVDPPDVA